MAAVVAAEMLLSGVIDKGNITELAVRDMAAGQAEGASGKSTSVLKEDDLFISLHSKGYLPVEKLGD